MTQEIIILLIAFIAIDFVLAFIAVAAWLYVAPARIKPGPTPQGFTDGDLGGVPAWLSSEIKPEATWFIFVHGYGGSRKTWLPALTGLAIYDVNAAALAMPGHDTSPLKKTGFGPAEASELLKAHAAVKALGAKKVVWVGVSLGGSACFLASEEAQPDGIISESAFPKLTEAVEAWKRQYSPFVLLILTPVFLLAYRFSGIKPENINPIEHAMKWRGRPALLIHSEKDQLFPKSFAERFAEATEEELWFVPDSTHAQVQKVAGFEYINRLMEFEKRI